MSQIPGIERYPHLKNRLEQRLRNAAGNCRSDCRKSAIIREFRLLVKAEDERARVTRSGRDTGKGRR